MNKSYLFKSFSVFRILLGTFFIVCPFLLNYWESPVAISSLLLGISLTLLGTRTYRLSLRQDAILKSIIENKNIALAHFQYSKKEADILHQHLIDEYKNYLLEVFLFLILGSLVAIGFYLASPVRGLVIAIVLLASLMSGSFLMFTRIKSYYRCLKNINLETVITKDSIYFLGQVYKLAPQGYPIKRILLKLLPTPLLQIECEFYGTTLSLAPSLSIPILSSDCESALKVISELSALS